MAKIRLAFGSSMFNYGVKIKQVIPPLYRYFVVAYEDKDKLYLVFKKSFNEVLYRSLINKLPVITNNKYNFYIYKKGDKYNFVILSKFPEVISDSEIREIENNINIGDIF